MPNLFAHIHAIISTFCLLLFLPSFIKLELIGEKLTVGKIYAALLIYETWREYKAKIQRDGRARTVSLLSSNFISISNNVTFLLCFWFLFHKPSWTKDQETQGNEFGIIVPGYHSPTTSNAPIVFISIDLPLLLRIYQLLHSFTLTSTHPPAPPTPPPPPPHTQPGLCWMYDDMNPSPPLLPLPRPPWMVQTCFISMHVGRT